MTAPKQLQYAELHCLSNFSFLKAASHPEELIEQASVLSYTALALTDECSVAGVVRAYAHHKSAGLDCKLIVGSSFTLEDGYLVVLLCPDRQAYAELCRVITIARRRCDKGQYCLYRQDLEQLKSVFVLWKPKDNSVDDDKFAAFLKQTQQGRAWLMYERHLGAQEAMAGSLYRAHCCALSAEYRLPMLCAGGVRMHASSRQPVLDVLNAIHENTQVQRLGLKASINAERSLRPLSKLRKLYAQQDIAETLRVAALCHFDLSCLQYEYPAELVPNGYSAMAYLKHLVGQGMRARFPQGASLPIQATIRKELQLIESQKYEYFFLTVHDIVQFAKQQKILYQGRGSAANSIVCYCLEITSVDPRQISVLFERFISKERNEPPDIDVDFEHQRREEVMQYIYKKYGRERAALAATVISFRYKSAFRSVGKALGIEESRLEYHMKNIDRRDHDQSWEEQLASQGLDLKSAQMSRLVSLTQSVIGFPRHLSQHVGGFVISAGPLSELVPVENAAMADRTVIQWDKDDLETLGLLKVDVLSLGMLSAIRHSFDMIRHHYKRALSIADITRMGDDPDVYADLQRGDSVGVFQVESRAQMSMLPRLKPQTYYDLVVQIAIVRPGPIQGDMVHPYLRRRSGKEAVTYPSKEVQDVLSRTLGVPIFQEQVIKLAMVAAGFTGGEADQLRRAMASWKRSTQLHHFRDKLIQGMLERGYDQGFAERVYQQICGFGEYGFPESHAASFAVLAYVSAWLKHYYPAAFFASLLNSLPMGFYSASQLMQDAQRHNVDVLPVDVNSSDYNHRLERTSNAHDLSLRLGLRLVRGLSIQGAQRVVAEKPKYGYSSLEQIQSLGLRQNDLEALASANALESLSGNRYQTRWELMQAPSYLPLFDAARDQVLDQSADLKADKGAVVNPSLSPDPRETSSQQCFAPPSALQSMYEDFATTGLSLNHHPIALLRQNSQLLASDTPANLLHQVAHKSLVSVVGLVTGKQSPGTASGVTFFTLEDETGNINVVVWRATARAQKEAYLRAKVLRVVGILEQEAGVIHVIAGRLEDLSTHLARLRTKVREFH